MRFQVEDTGDGRVDDVVDATLRVYRQRQVPIVWLVHPTSRPQDLGTRIESRGLVEADVVTGMVALLDDLPRSADPPGGVWVDELRPGAVDDFLSLLIWRYDLPPGTADTLRAIMNANRFGEPGSANRAWVARTVDGPVAKVTLHCDGQTAGIHGVATRPEARGRGLGRLMTTTALDAARDAGYELAVLHSTPMAVSLYKALGFEPMAEFRIHAYPDTLHL
jgi:ribosomal protein S18 acetylase RimI-like enzyme